MDARYTGVFSDRNPSGTFTSEWMSFVFHFFCITIAIIESRLVLPEACDKGMTSIMRPIYTFLVGKLLVPGSNSYVRIE